MALRPSGGASPRPHASRALEEAQEALLRRPRWSIQLRLVASLGLCFVLCAVFTFETLRVLERVRERLRFFGAGSEELDQVLHGAAILSVVLLALLLVFFVAITLAFTRALVVPIGRFKSYAARIAVGDFSLIRPARSFRDEFTDLAVAVNRMLAELQAQQERMLRGAKLAAVGTLASGVAHELNNPLNNIAITTEALMEDLATLPDEEKWRLLSDIYFEAERAGEIVRSLLDFTRQERPDLVPVDVGVLVQSTFRLVRNELELGGVTAVSEVPADLPPVRGAANPLRQVLLNLFLNAVQAMPNGGTLRVSAAPEEVDRVCVEVKDEGAGIPPETLPLVFDPFFTTKEPGKGTGLGLSVSLGIVRKLGGDIRIASEPGRGTTVHVCLPRAEAGDETPRPSPPPAPRAS